MSGVRTVGVVLFGCGTVGKAVLRRLAAAQAHHADKFQLAFKVRAVVDSAGAVLSEDEVDSDAVLECKEQHQPLSGLPGFVVKEEATGKLQALQQEPNIFVDCTATDGIMGLLQEALTKGAGVVFANKKCLTASMDDFHKFVHPRHMRRCRFESSVGAGTPFVASTQRVVAAHDTINSIQGTFSGTLGYITSGLDDGRRLSQLVQEAYDRGFTEPDPRCQCDSTARQFHLHP
ncbi:homoserine dehydrogenase [Salpingoeca rosetta]|uniref:homoserine dehydrogenase n=1 Tax=Salpingoeca rosetta (strain ATCC 50818 / BSB-021) TaxID=946362 RepID=F2UDS1_SALR5|nr:homoserine dehydrogenase [Salpingoeca rosetta]EGD74771.1 homoserine dehydrogenase [Salpingoeca rosetta]|eukprot:XP_004992416.1 homoserine dehydrogenase [Salpingoeca rosetta]